MKPENISPGEFSEVRRIARFRALVMLPLMKLSKSVARIVYREDFDQYQTICRRLVTANLYDLRITRNILLARSVHQQCVTMGIAMWLTMRSHRMSVCAIGPCSAKVGQAKSPVIDDVRILNMKIARVRINHMMNARGTSMRCNSSVIPNSVQYEEYSSQGAAGAQVKKDEAIDDRKKLAET